MKKYFIYALVALVAFSSCRGDNSWKKDVDPQGGGGGDDPTPTVANIKIKVVDVTATSADFNFIPSDKTKTYFWDICDIESWEEYGEKTIWSDCYDEEYLCTGDDLEGGYTNLDPSTTYVVFAAYCDANGNPLAKCDTAHFTTLILNPEDIFRTTITNDINYSSNDVVAYLDDYGDYYELGNRNWGIYIYGKDYVDGLQIEFFTNLSVTDPSGSYPIDSTLSCETGTALSGYEEYGYAFGCWYYSIDADSNITDPRAALVTGTVNITKASSGYDIELNAQDFHQHNVTFSAKGLDLIVEEASGTAVFTKRPALRTKADLNIKSPKRK